MSRIHPHRYLSLNWDVSSPHHIISPAFVFLSRAFLCSRYTLISIHMLTLRRILYNIIRLVNSSPLCISNKLNTHCLIDFANYAKHTVLFEQYQENGTSQTKFTFMHKQYTHTHTFAINCHASDTSTIHCFT